MISKPIRLAVIVSHPIQYYVPLYRRLAKRADLQLKVFYTWHAGPSQYDPGFRRDVSWDIPLTSGYEYEVVPNAARRAGSNHFLGIRNPELVKRVSAWEPDAVHITGYAYASHLNAMRTFHRRGVPVLFRGDSHLLDQSRGLAQQLKRVVTNRIYKWANVCLYVGKNNHDYFQSFGVPESKLFYCPHSIEVERFAEPNDELEQKARQWRGELSIPSDAKVLLFAGKFERKKRPVELMRAMRQFKDSSLILIMVGNGEFENQVQRIAAEAKDKFRVLPFQNQSAMPIVYRLADIFVLPSAYGETWGLAVNEAIACGRKVLVSNKVGCAPDIVEMFQEDCEVFQSDDWAHFELTLRDLLNHPSDREKLRSRAKMFDVPVTEEALLTAIRHVKSDSLASE